MYRIGIQIRDVASQFRAVTLQDFLQQFAGELFTLIVADHGNLNLLFMTEELMVAHLARHM